jgi:hypothetical protein
LKNNKKKKKKKVSRYLLYGGSNIYSEFEKGMEDKMQPEKDLFAYVNYPISFCSAYDTN